MGFSVWTFLFEVINFVVLAYVLHRLLYRPLHEAIDRRRQEAECARVEAERARQDAAALQRQLDARLAEIEHQRQEIIRQAHEQAEVERTRILSEANQAVHRRREGVEQDLQREHDEALRALRAELVRSAVGLADRLLREAADRSLHGQLVARLVETLRDLPEGERERLRDEWQAADGAFVETAEPVNGPVLDGLKATIADLAGRPVALSVQTRPALIGGIRLRMGGHLWDATLADRLDEARQAVPGGSHP